MSLIGKQMSSNSANFQITRSPDHQDPVGSFSHPSVFLSHQKPHKQLSAAISGSSYNPQEIFVPSNQFPFNSPPQICFQNGSSSPGPTRDWQQSACSAADLLLAQLDTCCCRCSLVKVIRFHDCVFLI